MIDALASSSIRFVTTRDERGAAFMADAYGAFTGRPGVCLATLGPGAINLMLGIANAHLDSHPLVAITAQASLQRLYKESHQAVDLVQLFRPITKWGGMITVEEAVPEMVRKAFKQARTERPGATFLILPEDVAEAGDDGRARSASTSRSTRRRRRRRSSARWRSSRERPRRSSWRDRGWRATVRWMRSCGSRRGLQPARGDDVPRQGRLPGRPPERARDDRLHGPRLRELRLRSTRTSSWRWATTWSSTPPSDGTRGGTRRSCTSTGRSPRSTRPTRSRSACRATSAPRWTRSRKPRPAISRAGSGASG